MHESVGQEILKMAGEKGCDAAEVFIKSARGISVEAKEGKVEALEASRDFGIALKVVKSRRLGFAFTTSPEKIGKTVDEAFEAAEWTCDDPYVDIPDNAPSSEVCIYDDHIHSLKEEDIIKDALSLEESALRYDKRIKRVRKAEVSSGVGTTTVLNSKGIYVSYRSSYYAAHVTTLAQDEKGESQMGWDYAGSRRLSDVNLTSVGRGAAQRAIDLLGSRKISTAKVPVILSPQVSVDFLEILSASLSSDAVQKQRSFLVGKTGRKIVSELVNIIDDGTLPWGTGTKPVDDEGVPTMNKTLVANGTLNGYLYNTYTAKKSGAVSTGNAARGGFKSLPGVGVTNIFIKGEDDRPGDILKRSLPRGLLIQGAMGVHTANPISGDFSVGISGLWIENGEVLYPVKEAVMSGNILDMFSRVEAVGSDLTFYGSSGAPSLLIGNMDISA